MVQGINVGVEEGKGIEEEGGERRRERRRGEEEGEEGEERREEEGRRGRRRLMRGIGERHSEVLQIARSCIDTPVP